MADRKPQELPASFAASIAPGSLGNRDTVAQLLGGYMDELEKNLRLLARREITPEHYGVMLKPMQEGMFEIFSGRNPAFPGTRSWNPDGLRGLLRVELHDYRVARNLLDQDPIQSFLEFLEDKTVEQIKAHPQDMQAYRAVMVEVYRIGIDKLMGTGARAVPPPPEELKMPSYGYEE